MDTREIRAAPANAAPNRVTTCVISDPRKIDPGECKSGWPGQVRRGGAGEAGRLGILPVALPVLPALPALPAPATGPRPRLPRQTAGTALQPALRATKSAICPR